MVTLRNHVKLINQQITKKLLKMAYIINKICKFHKSLTEFSRGIPKNEMCFTQHKVATLKVVD